MDYRRYSVSAHHKKPLLDFILDALTASGCRILRSSTPEVAPFRISFEDPSGVRQGIIAYAFFANSRTTLNRPSDEHRFQIKYGTKDGQIHTIWQDPFEIYTTLLLGIDLERGVFIGIDPVLHEFTKFFISIEFKRVELEAILDKGWHSWERTRKRGHDAPIETMVGGQPKSFLNYVRFEQAARGLDQGHRFLLAEKLLNFIGNGFRTTVSGTPNRSAAVDTHALAQEFEISEDEILSMIEAAPRLKMAVRGWVAEHHLQLVLNNTPGVDKCTIIEEDGRPDFEVVFRGREPILIECKNVLRKTLVDGTKRIDFQKTRASKNDPCSRFYRPTDFEVLAACLHPISEKWEFAYKLTSELDLRTKNCLEHMSNNVRISTDWTNDPAVIFEKFHS